jgi:hypothetical protein
MEARGIESSGSPSMVPSSPVVVNRVLTLVSDETDGVSIRETGTMDSGVTHSVPLVAADGWDCVARPQVMDTVNVGPFRFRFDPSSLDVYLPIALRLTVFDRLKLRVSIYQVRKDSVMDDPSALYSVLFSVQLPPGATVLLSPHDLWHHPDFTNAYSVHMQHASFCPFRLRFSANPFIVLGS